MSDTVTQPAEQGIAEQTPRPNPDELAARITGLTDKVIQRALAVPVEHRQDGSHYGSPGIKVMDSSGDTPRITAVGYPVESRISVTPNSVTLESFEKGPRKRDAMASTSASFQKSENGRVRSGGGYVTERTPSGSAGHPASGKEVNRSAIRTLKHIRSEVVRAEARHKDAKIQAA